MARFDFIAAYLLANRNLRTLYTGSTAVPAARMEAHKAGTGSIFAAKYGCARLVWFERFGEMAQAIAMEKQLKRWPRKRKIELIESVNPDWDELPVW